MTRTNATTTLRRPLFGRKYPKMARALDEGGLAERRRELLTGLTGEVIEVGAGHGVNFAHYPAAGRDTVAEIERAGFTVREIQRFLLPQARTPFSFYALGTATSGV